MLALAWLLSLIIMIAVGFVWGFAKAKQHFIEEVTQNKHISFNGKIYRFLEDDM